MLCEWLVGKYKYEWEFYFGMFLGDFVFLSSLIIARYTIKSILNWALIRSSSISCASLIEIKSFL